VIPGQHLRHRPVSGRVPGQADALRDQLFFGAANPAVEVEMLAPAVEDAAVPPDRLDDPPHPSVATRQQPLDQTRSSIGVPDADGPTALPVVPDTLLQLPHPLVGDFRVGLSDPLEGGVWLGDERTDADGAADVPVPGGLASGLDHAVR